MATIRTFQNGDLPGLREVWNQHWSALGPPPQVGVAQFEQAILARTFFHPSQLWVVDNGHALEAWCHWLPAAETAAGETSPREAMVGALCFTPDCPSDASDRLLDQVLQKLASSGFGRVRAGVVRDHHFGYAGLDPIGHGIGIPDHDRRLADTLDRAGFRPHRAVTRWVATVTGYRPPVNRTALQYRRVAEVESQRVFPENPRDAASMSHLDIERHRLTQRGGEELADVDLWLSDPEAEVMPPSLAILDVGAAHDRDELDPAASYLVSAVVQSLAPRRISRVETAIDSDHTNLAQQLTSLQFQPADSGTQWYQAKIAER